MIKQCVAGKLSLHELKPKIESSRILFPLSVSSKYIEEDGLSFGFPVDFGWVTEINYDFTVGVLTEDTISIFRALKMPKHPSQGVQPIETYSFSESELNAWREGLDQGWADARYQEWLEKGLVDEGETKEQFIANELDCYHSWPIEWRAAYDKARGKMNAPIGEKNTVLVNGDLTLYSDDNEDYFFSTKYHDHGNITKADNVAAQEYIGEFEIYQAALVEHKRKLSNLRENLELLRSTLTAEQAAFK